MTHQTVPSAAPQTARKARACLQVVQRVAKEWSSRRLVGLVLRTLLLARLLMKRTVAKICMLWGKNPRLWQAAERQGDHIKPCNVDQTSTTSGQGAASKLGRLQESSSPTRAKLDPELAPEVMQRHLDAILESRKAGGAPSEADTGRPSAQSSGGLRAR